MSFSPKRLVGSLGLVTLGLLGACSDSTSSASYSCCQGESYYSCSSKSAADACFSSGNTANCTRDSSKDSSCKSGS